MILCNIVTVINVMTVIYPKKNKKAEQALETAKNNIENSIQKLNSEIEKSICLQLLQKINGMRGNGIIDGEASENEFQLKLSLF